MQQYDNHIEDLKKRIITVFGTEKIQEINEILEIIEQSEPKYNYNIKTGTGSTCPQEMKFIVK